MKDRLQFRHHSQVFDTREAAIEYIKSQIRFAEEGLAATNKELGYSLFAEPTVLLYKNEEDDTSPHLLFVIGSVTNVDGVETGYAQYSDNRFCIIDIDKTEKEIADLGDEIAKTIKSLTLIPKATNTLSLYSEKTDDGTFISGDVKVADTHIFDDNIKRQNNLMVTDDGLFIYITLTYDEEAETFKFVVTNADGSLSETSVKLPNNYLVSGYYDKPTESLHLVMRESEEVVIDCEELIAEWGVEGDASKTPVILTREEIDYDHTEEHHHVEPWQDILKADIRIKDENKELLPDGTYRYVKDANSTNILNRTSDGRCLYVDGKASNIIYYKSGQKTNVKEVLDELGNIKLSTDNENIIINKVDGFFASAKLNYISKENKLVFKVSGQEDTILQLNSFRIFENIYYDPTKEAIVITYIDGNDQMQIVEIPIGEMIRDWEWEVQNEGHNVKLVKTRHISGNDKLSADVNIFEGHNNILIDNNHSLYVRGEADNIKYGDNSNVKKALDNLNEANIALDGKIDAETERAIERENVINDKIDKEIADRTSEINRLDNTLGSGFSTDTHETVTYKFNELTDRLAAEESRANNEEARIENKFDEEVARLTAKDEEEDGRLDSIEANIGEGFGPRNTVRDELNREKSEREASDNILSETIENLSANTETRLKSVVNNDHSINVDNTDAVNPVIKVNLSSEVEDGKENIIKLNTDGLYAGVDLSYEEAANKLIFKTTNSTKEIQLESMSSIIDMRYDPIKEAIIVTYMTNGHEIKTLEIPVGDLINEWRIWDGHEGAIQLEKIRVSSGTSEQDILKASVVISDTHDDNIVVNDNGALYVSGKGISENKADIDALKERMTSSEEDIDSLNIALADEIVELNHEIENRISGDTILRNALNDETSRARETETRIETALSNEVSRSQDTDADLYDKINDEALNRTNADNNLQTLIGNETTRAISAESIIREAITNEIGRSTAEDERLNDAITAEVADRQAAYNTLNDKIDAATLSFDDTSSVDFAKDANNVVTANVRLQEGDNIIKLGSGLYASVHLSYDPGTNKIKLVTSNGSDEEIQLVGASLLEDLHYDSTNKQLVITYKDATGVEHTVSFGVSELFNEWHIENPSEKSAIELIKVAAAEPGGEDVLKGRVLITDDRDGDGKPDEGSINVIEIRNNGLFVDGTAMAHAKETVDCVKNELTSVEKAIFGSAVSEECGSGFTYEPPIGTSYIGDSTSLNNAVYNLDKAISIVSSNTVTSESKIDLVSANTICVDGKVNATYELMFGQGQILPSCGEGASFLPYNGCVISAATSLHQADQMLNDALCNMINNWFVYGFDTPSNHTSWKQIGENRHMLVDLRMSHGVDAYTSAAITDPELTIENFNGGYVEPNVPNFSDTNVLRIVNITEGKSGEPLEPDNAYNGLYLSNYWNCGKYYDQSESNEVAEMVAEGYEVYNDNYKTDTSTGTSDINYSNYVR